MMTKIETNTHDSHSRLMLQSQLDKTFVMIIVAAETKAIIVTMIKHLQVG
jgi:hypothetical protein